MLADAQRVQVVVEAQAVPLETAVQRPLARMAERWMADVVHERKGLRQVLVQLKRGGDRTRNLRDFDGVGQPRAEVIGRARGEDLRLARQPAKGTRLHDALAVALERAAVMMLGSREGACGKDGVVILYSTRIDRGEHLSKSIGSIALAASRTNCRFPAGVTTR